IITAVIRTRPFLTADRTVAGTPNSRTLAALASFEPRHGEAPASRHVVRKPARAGRQAAPEPRQPGPLNATTPTHCHPGQDRTVYQKSQLGGSVQGYRVLGRFLVRIPGSNRALGLDPNATPQFTTTPGQVAFTPDGSQLVVTTKGNGNDIDVF